MDDLGIGVVGDRPLGWLQAVGLHLAAHQVALGDLKLLVLGVAREPHDLHAVLEGRRDVKRVCGGDEHHVGQVVIDLQVMVVELVVLLGVKHLKQRRSRVATEVHAHLVDFVEQEERVGLLAVLAHRLDDLAGHRADIGAPVASIPPRRGRRQSLDREIHWMYNKSRLQPWRKAKGSYLELVVSASQKFAAMSREEAIDLAVRELAEFFPEVARARLEKAALVKEVRATFTVPPGIDAARPGSVSPWPNCILAGDWIQTGWPSTMESAARSGHMAAEAVCAAMGDVRSFVNPDLKPRGLMRFIR